MVGNLDVSCAGPVIRQGWSIYGQDTSYDRGIQGFLDVQVGAYSFGPDV